MAFTYLALGDSYTIGEQVRITENFPYQTVQLLRKKAIRVHAPEIIAATGWTTDELSSAIEATVALEKYDIVSLLIGVNNQYRGRSAKEFMIELEHLLQKSIQFAGNNAKNVFLLSIPDWSVTPFAAGRDKNKIAEEIDQYNTICKNAAEKFQPHFIDITMAQRADGNKAEFLAGDGLHPSGKEYAKWAAVLSEFIIKQIN